MAKKVSKNQRTNRPVAKNTTAVVVSSIKRDTGAYGFDRRKVKLDEVPDAWKSQEVLKNGR